jgi:Tfp pilus assembly protein PilF
VLAAQHVNLGVMEERAGNDAAAIDEYRAALALEPGLVQARYAIGNALARLGRSAEARREYEALLANDERYAPFVSNSLGIIALEEGDAPAAVVAFRRALEGDPAPTTHANLGVALLTLWEEMKNRSLRARWPDGIVRNAAGDSVGYASAPSAAWSASVLDSVTLAKPEMIIDEAIDELGTAWRSGQVPGDVGVDLARARLAAGDTARAESDLREVVQRDQSTLRAWLLTAEIARARNDRVVEAGALGCALILRPDLGDARARLAELRAAR